VEGLKDSLWYVRRAAIDALSGLVVQAVFREDGVVEGISTLAEQAELRKDIWNTIPAIAEHLKDSRSDVRKAAIELLSRLAVLSELRKDIQVAIPGLVEWMRNSNEDVSNSVLELLSELVTCSHLSDVMQIITVFFAWTTGNANLYIRIFFYSHSLSFKFFR